MKGMLMVDWEELSAVEVHVDGDEIEMVCGLCREPIDLMVDLPTDLATLLSFATSHDCEIG